MASSLESPTGDSMAARLQDKSQTYNLSDVTSDLMNAHAHRPGLFKGDLQKVNLSLHSNNMLAGFDIVGLKGKDLIAQNTSTNETVLVDAADPTRTTKLSTDLTETQIGANGRLASLAQDGSGTYKVVSGDSAWRIASDILTNQGFEKPSDNQIANYIKELEATNTRSLKKIQIGEQINIPAVVKDGQQSDFTPLSPDERDEVQRKDIPQSPPDKTPLSPDDRDQAQASSDVNPAPNNVAPTNDASSNNAPSASSNDAVVPTADGTAVSKRDSSKSDSSTTDVQPPLYTPLDTSKPLTQSQVTDQMSSIERLTQEMHSAYDKIKTGDEPDLFHWFSHTQTNEAAIDSALTSTQSNLSAADREGLLMLKQNYAALKTNADGNLYAADIDTWANLQYVPLNQAIDGGAIQQDSGS